MQKGCHVPRGKDTPKPERIQGVHKVGAKCDPEKSQHFWGATTGPPFPRTRKMGVLDLSFKLKGNVTLAEISFFWLYSLIHSVYCSSVHVIIQVLLNLY